MDRAPGTLEEDSRWRGWTDVVLWLGVLVWYVVVVGAIWPFFFVKSVFKMIRAGSFFALGAGLVIADQATKWTMWNYLGRPGGRVVLVPGYLDLTLVTNQGAAFGLFPGQTLVFVLMALLTIAIILAYLSMIGREEKLVRVALVCIMAGAIGNLIDRVALGHVIDFIDAHYGPHHWPVFNLADTVIDLGVGLILIDVVRDFFRARDRVAAAS